MKTATILGLMGGTVALTIGGNALLFGLGTQLVQAAPQLADLKSILIQFGTLGLPVTGLVGAMLARSHPHHAAVLMGGSAALLTRVFVPGPLSMAAIILLGLAAVMVLSDRTLRGNAT